MLSFFIIYYTPVRIIFYFAHLQRCGKIFWKTAHFQIFVLSISCSYILINRALEIGGGGGGGGYFLLFGVHLQSGLRKDSLQAIQIPFNSYVQFQCFFLLD